LTNIDKISIATARTRSFVYAEARAQ